MENCTDRNMEVKTGVRIYSVISLCTSDFILFYRESSKLLKRCNLVFHFLEIKHSLDSLSFSLSFKASM